MKEPATRHYLQKLKDLILEERRCAINLDQPGMEAVMQEKEEVIKILAHVKILDDADKPLAEEIRRQNRRNAFLFKSTLGWLRSTMEFFGHSTVPSTYGSGANTIASETHGRLLSGRV